MPRALSARGGGRGGEVGRGGELGSRCQGGPCVCGVCVWVGVVVVVVGGWWWGSTGGTPARAALGDRRRQR